MVQFRAINCLALTCLLLAATAVRSIASSDVVYSGRAFAVTIAPANGSPQSFGDTGNVPADGTQQNASVVSQSISGLLVLKTTSATTYGLLHDEYSSVSIERVEVFRGGFPYTLTATLVSSSSHVGISGLTLLSSQIGTLKVGGHTITVTGAVNQTVLLPGGITLILNQQNSYIQGTHVFGEVNAIHLIVPGVGEAVVGHSSSDIEVAP